MTIEPLSPSPPPHSSAEVPVITGTKIALKLVRMMELVGHVPKDKKNPHFGYLYASDEAIKNAIHRALVECKVVAVPNFYVDSDGLIETRKGEKDRLVRMGCSLLVIDAESGETASINAYGCGQDASDKAEMKAETSALKCCWLQLLNIPTGADPEADKRTDEQMDASRRKAATQKPAEATQAAAGSQPSPERTGKLTGVKIDVAQEHSHGTIERGRDKGRKWTLYEIIDSTKTSFFTFEKKKYTLALEINKTGSLCDVEWAIDSKGTRRIGTITGYPEFLDPKHEPEVKTTGTPEAPPPAEKTASAPGLMYWCTDCKFETPDLDELGKHHQEKHPENDSRHGLAPTPLADQTYACTQCDFESPNITAMQKHYKEKHSDRDAKKGSDLTPLPRSAKRATAEHSAATVEPSSDPSKYGKYLYDGFKKLIASSETIKALTRTYNSACEVRDKIDEEGWLRLMEAYDAKEKEINSKGDSA